MILVYIVHFNVINNIIQSFNCVNWQIIFRYFPICFLILLLISCCSYLSPLPTAETLFLFVYLYFIFYFHVRQCHWYFPSLDLRHCYWFHTCFTLSPFVVLTLLLILNLFEVGQISVKHSYWIHTCLYSIPYL